MQYLFLFMSLDFFLLQFTVGERYSVILTYRVTVIRIQSV